MRCNKSALFDHLVGADEERLPHGKAKRLHRLQVDHELEFRWLLYGKVGGLGALQDLIDVDCGLSIRIGLIGPIAQQAALVCEIADEGHRRQSIADREFGTRRIGKLGWMISASGGSLSNAEKAASSSPLA